jgi:hypothetical protein
MVVSIPPDGSSNASLAAQRSPASPVGVPHGRALRAIPFSRPSLAVLLALSLTVSLSACAMQNTPDFDSSAWKSQRGATGKDNTRGRMVATLEKSLHAGMSRDDVIRLLGEPDSTDADTATDVYELGVATYGIDEEFYEIQYQDGKLASHRWARR